MPRVIPSGTITFLFTDIEGSTERWEHHEAAMRSALQRHDALLREAIEGAGGYVFKTVGDAFCAAFATAGAGIGAAVDAQHKLFAEDWSVFGESFPPIRVRMGLHTGEVQEREGDYFGRPVNRAARLEAAANGGQVMLSRATYQLVAEGLPDELRLRELGEHRLKDLRNTEFLYQVVIDGLPDIEVAPRTVEELHPRDRIQVAAPDGGLTASGHGLDVDEALWRRLHDAITGDGRDDVVTLSAEEAAALARHKPIDAMQLRLGRVAEWSQPRYRLDGRFVGLTLLLDQGEEATLGRWQESGDQTQDLRDVLAVQDSPVSVVLGPPGSGKSTLLRRLELDTAIDALRGEGEDVITFFVQLNTYAPAAPGEPPPAPAAWLAERWAVRNPDLPSFEDLLKTGRMLLLLDAFNEMPASSESEYHARAQLWRTWLQQTVSDYPGNRMVFSCRSLDYSQPLSTPALRVPQVRVDVLSNEQVIEFLSLYSPVRWREIWAELEGSPQLEVLRSPYFLSLLVDQVESSGEMPDGRAALFTGFVRQALRREVERGNPQFQAGDLIATRDLRRVTKWKWKSPWDLPERGVLLTKLAELAYEMQADRDDTEMSQVRIDVDDAFEMLDDDHDEQIVAAGAALAVLDEDETADELMYVHQLIQEYFAARALARRPNPDLVASPWRISDVSPSLSEVVEELDPADPLPTLPQTGWEETTLLASAMSDDPAAFVAEVATKNLVLAGRCAAQPDVGSRLPAVQLAALREQLAERSRDPQADLRERIACATVVGELGDPRFARHEGPHGVYLLPPLIDVVGGEYVMGGDEPITHAAGVSEGHIPRHTVALEAFRIGQFAVTNAEFRCFVDAGGYDDSRWWDIEPAGAWQRGEITNEGNKANNRFWHGQFKANPEQLEAWAEQGVLSEDLADNWRRWIALDDDAFEAELDDVFPARKIDAPRYIQDNRYNAAAQPVTGICCYEARAYCRWLSAQTGLTVRRPSEADWEAAARGAEGRSYPWGDTFGAFCANCVETHIRTTTPVGVLLDGDTPEGVADLCGNAYEWTTSAWGPNVGVPHYAYPYDPADGREDLALEPNWRRVIRGGAWYFDPAYCDAIYRYDFPPAGWADVPAIGLRILVEVHDTD